MGWEGGRREHVRDKRSTSFCVKCERLECYISVTCDFGYWEKNRVSRTQRWARRVKHLDVLHRGCCTRSARGDKMRICAGNASVQKEMNKRTPISVRQRKTAQNFELTLLPSTSTSLPHRWFSQRVCHRVRLRWPSSTIEWQFDFRQMGWQSGPKDISPRSSTTT